MGYDVHLWVNDYAIVPRVTGDFGALVWYQSQRHNVPLPSPAQDIFVHDPLAEARAAEPTLADLRRDVTMSPLLAQIPDEDLDRLAASSRRARYRAGELIMNSGAANSDVMVLIEGTGRLVLLRPGRDETVISDLGAGDLVGLLNPRRAGDWIVAARAVTDCDVLAIDGDVLGQVGSRNAEVVAAFNRVAMSRQRRIDRLVSIDRPTLDVPRPRGGDA
jgi:CRP-like cAMP-binding protein